jgi:pyruvate dehydrogenase complex dehydrogenase (E1) component
MAKIKDLIGIEPASGREDTRQAKLTKSYLICSQMQKMKKESLSVGKVKLGKFVIILARKGDKVGDKDVTPKRLQAMLANFAYQNRIFPTMNPLAVSCNMNDNETARQLYTPGMAFNIHDAPEEITALAFARADEYVALGLTENGLLEIARQGLKYLDGEFHLGEYILDKEKVLDLYNALSPKKLSPSRAEASHIYEHYKEWLNNE